eukprot:915136-Prorocentrum_lima.AAC.1
MTSSLVGSEMCIRDRLRDARGEVIVADGEGDYLPEERRGEAQAERTPRREDLAMLAAMGFAK